MAIRCCHGVTIAMTLIAAIMAGASVGLVWTRGTTGSIDVDMKLFKLCINGACESWDKLIPHNSDPWCAAVGVSSGSSSSSGSGQSTATIGSTNGITNKVALGVIRVAEATAIVATFLLVVHAAVLTAWANGKIRSSCAPVATGVLSMLVAGGAAGAWIGFEHLCNHTLCEQLTGAVASMTRRTDESCRESEGFGLVISAGLFGILTLCTLCARRPSDARIDQHQMMSQAMVELQPSQPAPGPSYGDATPRQQQWLYAAQPISRPAVDALPVYTAEPIRHQRVYAAQPANDYQ